MTTLKIENKKAIVAELAEIASHAVSVIAAEYRGLSVAETTKLRVNARKVGVKVKIYPNTLSRKAVEGTRFECLQSALVGPMLLLFSQDEPGAAARMVRDYAKDHEKFMVKALVLEGRLLAADQLKAVASMPSRDEARVQLLAVMNGPMTKLARTLLEPSAQFARVLSAQAAAKKQ